MNIAIVGATGMVGQKFLELLRERDFPVERIRLFASSKSKGKVIVFKSQSFLLESLSDTTSLKNIDIAFFSAGEDISREWSPRFAKAGAFVIDNSSAFRMEKSIPLIVPEVNGDQINRMGFEKGSALGNSPGIIANPNCSTIQLVMVLSPLSKNFGLSAVHVSSYQAVSGAGRSALKQLKEESQVFLKGAVLEDSCADDKSLEHKGSVSLPAHSKSVAFNCIPQIGRLNPAGFSTEEWKLMQETKKILNLPALKVTATAVRVPVFNGHSEAVLLTLKEPVGKIEVIEALSAQKGLKILEGGGLPHQRFVDGQDDVYVGRIRPVPEEIDGITSLVAEETRSSKEWMMWVTGDNLRKGAALNGLQIAETLIQHKDDHSLVRGTL